MSDKSIENINKEEKEIIIDEFVKLKHKVFKNKKYIDIRKYYKDDSNKLKPTKKGIMLDKKQWDNLLKFSNIINEYFEK